MTDLSNKVSCDPIGSSGSFLQRSDGNRPIWESFIFVPTWTVYPFTQILPGYFIPKFNSRKIHVQFLAKTQIQFFHTGKKNALQSIYVIQIFVKSRLSNHTQRTVKLMALTLLMLHVVLMAGFLSFSTKSKGLKWTVFEELNRRFKCTKVDGHAPN